MDFSATPRIDAAETGNADSISPADIGVNVQ